MTLARATRGALVALLAASLLSACGGGDNDSEEVLGLVEATELLPHRFVYTEDSGGTETVVKGLVEDDFRYKARVTVDGEDVLDEVVDDDTAAVRFIDPSYLNRYIDKAATSFVDPETDLDGVTVFDALQARRWVVDPGGAPAQLVNEDLRTEIGVDPFADARRVLERVSRIAAAEFPPFVRYDPDSIGTVYRTDEDPFPRPERGSELTRYDLVQPEFPADAGTSPNLPGEDPFRKLSVYVKDGRVVRVMEQVGLAPTVLEDFRDYMIRVIDTTAPDDVAERFERSAESLRGEALGEFLLGAMNTLRDLQGDPQVRFRATSYELLDLGADDIGVELPTGELIEADLAVLVNLGVKPPEALEADAEDGDDAGAGGVAGAGAQRGTGQETSPGASG